MKLSEFIPVVFKEEKDYSIGERSIALLCLTLAILSIIIGIPINIIINASLEIHLINLAGIIILTGIFFLITYKKIRQKHLWILFIPINLILIFVYIQEDGAKGPTFLFWLTFAFFFAAVEQWSKYIMLFISVLVMSGLIYLEINNPMLVQSHNTLHDSILNNYMVAVVCLITIFAWVSYLIDLNKKERQKVIVQKQMIEAQNKQIIELSALERDMNNMKLDFYTHISHEIRTPLTLISAPLQKLLEKEDDKDKRKYLEHINRNVHTIHNLIDQVMDLRKIDVRELKLQASLQDLVSFTSRIVRSFTDLAESSRVKLTFNSEWPDFAVMFDKVKLERALVNLISNAIKFTSKEGEVEISLCNGNNNTVKIIIRDTGKGIEEDQLSNIFNPFYQVQDTQHGTGIGLTIVKEYIHLHKGTIHVNSKVGKGTEFIIGLPLMDSQETWNMETNEGGKKMEKIEQATGAGSYMTPDQEGKNNTLLIIDDNQDIVHYLQDEFSASYETITAFNGEEGLAKANEHQPDLVIADVMMPVMDGVEFCKKLKEQTTTSHIPVILLTAKTADEHYIEGYQSGADDYITKPFSMEVLDVRIQNIIEQREKLYEIFASSPQEVDPKEMTTTTQDQEFLEKAYRLIRNNLSNQDFGVTEMVDQMNVSRSLLHIKLKKLVNLSTSEFIMVVRLRSAARLMRTTTNTISQISYDVGFSDPTYFTKMFKKYFNQTPKEYRA